QKAYLKSLLPEDLVDELFETSREDLLRGGGRFLEMLGKLKEACRNRSPDEEIIPILREMMDLLPNGLVERLMEQSERLEGLKFDEELFPLPLTKDEERWLEEVIERNRGQL